MRKAFQSFSLDFTQPYAIALTVIIAGIHSFLEVKLFLVLVVSAIVIVVLYFTCDSFRRKISPFRDRAMSRVDQ